MSQVSKRLAVVLGGFSLAAGAIVACSGSDDQEVTETPDTGVEAAAIDTGVDTGTDTGVKDATVDRGPVYDAGPPVILDGGDFFEGGVPCVLGGALEEELNDEPATANTLAPTRCGIIFLGEPTPETDAAAINDAGLTPEKDFLTFELKPATKSFYLQFSGDIRLVVTVEGHDPITITKTTSPTLPFVRNKPYYVEVQTTTGGRTPWRVTLFEN